MDDIPASLTQTHKVREALLKDLYAVTQEQFPTLDQMRNLLNRTEQFTHIAIRYSKTEALQRVDRFQTITKVQIQGVNHDGSS